MKWNDMSSYFMQYIPYKRRSSMDWIVPASIGLGIGIAAGVGIGLLSAPSAGVETRRKLREGAERVKDRAMDAAQRAKANLGQREAGQFGHHSYANDIGQAR